jgi:hypothetical protein
MKSVLGYYKAYYKLEGGCDVAMVGGEWIRN